MRSRPAATGVPRTTTSASTGCDLSSVAELSRRFRLREPVARGDLFAWYGEQLEAAGWSERHADDSGVIFARAVGDRRHWFDVEAGTALVDEFTVNYRIGFREER